VDGAYGAFAAALPGASSDDIALSRAMAAAIDRHPQLELLTQALSITTFRYVPPDLRGRGDADLVEAYLNELNGALLEVLQRSGELFVSNAVIRGRYALRACVVNFHTDVGDVEAVPDIVCRHGAALDRERRPVALARAPQLNSTER
jgi:glutamate/tyrosine decarboxylase-like PLP-dependent enzyme